MTAVVSFAPGTNAVADSGLEWRRGRSPVESNAQYESSSPREEVVAFVAHQEFRHPAARTRVATGSAKFRSIMVQRDPPVSGPTVRSSQLPAREDSLFDEPPQSSYDELPDVDTFGLPDEEDSLIEETEEIETYRAPQGFQPPTSDDYAEPRDMDDAFVDDADDFDENYALGAADMEDEQRKAREFCAEALADLKANTLDKLDLSIAVSGMEGEDIPYECSIDDGTQFAGRCWPETVYMWKASALCHKPLYFEDEQLERYGHSWGPCLQPLVSGAHFFGTLPVLPYCMGVNPPLECQYTLGYYRPGSCAPYMINPVPLSARAGLIQAGAVVGAAAAIP